MHCCTERLGRYLRCQRACRRVERMKRHSHCEQGQTLVEAAFLLPVVFFMFGLLLQPALLLYCHCVMDGAAAETCRLAATGTCGQDAMKAFALRRLDALPALDIFHSQDCAWEFDLGSSGSGNAQVTITGHVKTLPLVGITASTLTSPAGDGCGVISCTASSSSLPAWLNQDAVDAEGWVNRSWA